VKIKTILKDYVYLDDFYSDVELIDIRYNTIEEKKLYIDLCYNIIINRCLAEYQESSIMVGAFEGVSIIAPNDTIRAGDFFEAKIYFSVRDLTLNYNIELEDSVFFSGDIYKEKAIKKGLNTRKGRLIYLNGRKELIFPFEFSYYVK
jgi:hypothetical protein